MVTSPNAPLATPASARRVYDAIKSNSTLDLFKHGPLVIPRDRFDALVVADKSFLSRVRFDALARIQRDRRWDDNEIPVLPSDVLEVFEAMFEPQSTFAPRVNGGKPVRINPEARSVSKRKMTPGKALAFAYPDGWYVPAERSWEDAMRWVQWRINDLARSTSVTTTYSLDVQQLEEEPLALYDFLGVEDEYFALDPEIRDEIEDARESGDQVALDALRFRLAKEHGIEPTWDALKEHVRAQEPLGDPKVYGGGYARKRPVADVWHVVPGLLRGMHDPNEAATDVVPGHSKPRRMTRWEHLLALGLVSPTTGGTMYATKEDVDRLRAEIEERLRPLEDEHEARVEDGIKWLLDEADDRA